jgi:hypothetical protein
MWRHTVTHGRGREGETAEWSGKPVPFSLPRNRVYAALFLLMPTPQLPVVDWTDDPADLNGLVRFAERRNLVSAHVPWHFNRPLLQHLSPVLVFDNLYYVIILSCYLYLLPTGSVLHKVFPTRNFGHDVQLQRCTSQLSGFQIAYITSALYSNADLI